MVTKTVTSFEDRVGQVLLDAEFITAEQLEEARRASEGERESLLDNLVSMGFVARETLMTVLSFQLRIPVADLKHVGVDPEAVKLIPEDVARRHRVLPYGFDPDGSLRVATVVPNDFQLSNQLTSLTGRQIKFVLALSGSLDELIDRTYSSISVAPGTVSIPAQETVAASGQALTNRAAPPQQSSPVPGQLGQDISHLPATQAVEIVTLQAVKRNASDVHLVPTSDSGNVLFRVDGALRKMIVVPLTLHETMVSRIKVLADMDISESRRPQDGGFSIQFGDKKVDFRVSSIGTTWGEMVVLRILDRFGGVLSLGDLGLESTVLHVWRQLLSLPFGMLLVSGPTGSGKTTTLYASVAHLAEDRGNIMTVEDPVESRLGNVNQIEVNRAAGIDFATGLRAIMRLDPDIILVGEIRDSETAKAAVDAALTGHLVLASIHSNDAAASVVRPLDLGIEPYLIATAIAGALAQRLVRKICPHCKIENEPNATEAVAYEAEMQDSAGPFWTGQGCNFCEGTGFSGRIGVFEVLTATSEQRKLIAAGASGQEIRSQALNDGMIPLRTSGMLAARQGVTTMEEVLRNVFFID